MDDILWDGYHKLVNASRTGPVRKAFTSLLWRYLHCILVFDLIHIIEL